MKSSQVRHLTIVALMGTISFILMYFSFSIPFLSPFAEFNVSSVSEVIGGFILGPVGAMEIIGVKLLLKLIFKGTSSMFVGELQNFILSLAFMLPAVLYYHKHKTKSGAIKALAIGSITNIVVAIFTSVYLIFPAYIELYGMNWNGIIEICSAVNPWIKDIPTMVAFSVIPFNVVSRAVVSFLTVLIYKKVSIPVKNLAHQGEIYEFQHKQDPIL